MLTVIRLLLQLAVLLINRQSSLEQQRIGADRVVKDALIQLALTTQVAKQINIDSNRWDDATVDDILRKYKQQHGDRT